MSLYPEPWPIILLSSRFRAPMAYCHIHTTPVPNQSQPVRVDCESSNPLDRNFLHFDIRSMLRRQPLPPIRTRSLARRGNIKNTLRSSGRLSLIHVWWRRKVQRGMSNFSFIIASKYHNFRVIASSGAKSSS